MEAAVIVIHMAAAQAATAVLHLAAAVICMATAQAVVITAVVITGMFFAEMVPPT